MDWSELRNWNEYIKLLIGLLALSDPLGVQTVLLGLTTNHTQAEKRTITQASIITFIITLTIFTYFGIAILDLFGITTAALKIAGGVLFFFYALEMMGLIVLPTSSTSENSSTSSLGIVPIGIPLLAGPGTLSAIVIYADLHEPFAHKILINLVVISAGVIIYLIFRAGFAMGNKLNNTTMVVMNRVMGLILAAIAIEFILDGIVEHFPNLTSIH